MNIRVRITTIIIMVITGLSMVVTVPDVSSAAGLKDQQIKFDRIINARDLGGYKTKDGRRVKRGMLIRCSELSYASKSDLKMLKNEYKTKYVIDLRYKYDYRKCPDRKIKGIKYVNIPATYGKATKSKNRKAAKRYRTLKKKKGKKFKVAFAKKGGKASRSYTYRLVMSSYSKKAYRRYFKYLLKNDGTRCVVFHCIHGKDRTGVAAFMTLIALGVSEEDAYRDYAMTNANVKSLIPKASKRRGLGVRKSDLKYAIKKAKRKYGSMDNFLKRAYGLDAKDRKKLREIYTY